MIRARSMKSSRTSSFAIRSSSRRRWRVSTSASPPCLSGGGRSALASRTKASTRSEISPRRERSAAPSTPTRSPMSSAVSRANASSPRTSRRACSWILPLRSTRSRNAEPPDSRRAARRPATRWCSSVSSPAFRWSYAASTDAIGSTSWNVYGNALASSRRRRSAFSRRSATSRSRPWRRESSPSSDDEGPSVPLMAARLLEPYVDLRDLELARGAARHLHGDRLVAFAPDQRAPYGRLVREQLFLRGRLGGPDDRVLYRFAGLL